MKEYQDMLYSLAPVMDVIGNSICKKVRTYHENDKRHLAKMKAKRHKRNKNRKTHRMK